jgi:excisionase family DNA binding protein
MSDQLLTVNQAAARLAVGRVTVYELIRDGQLASLKIGKARRIPERAVEAFIEARLAAGASDDAA